MFYFILEMIFFVALSIAVLLILRALPLVDGFEEVKPSRGTVGIFEKVMKWHWVEKADDKLHVYFFKMLRRVKVWIMKCDVYVAGWLEKINPKAEGNGEGQHVIHALQEGRDDKNAENGDKKE